MTLQELNNYIHSLHTTDEISQQYPNIIATLSNILDQSNLTWQETYFQSHTGRELYRKLWTYDLKNLIPGEYYGGFQPKSKDDIIAQHAILNGGNLLCEYVLCN